MDYTVIIAIFVVLSIIISFFISSQLKKKKKDQELKEAHKPEIKEPAKVIPKPKKKVKIAPQKEKLRDDVKNILIPTKEHVEYQEKALKKAKSKPAKRNYLKNEEYERLLETYKIKRIYHATHKDNLERIIFNGLYSNNLAYGKGLIQYDLSNGGEKDKYKKRKEPTRDRLLQDYAGAYFNIKNPTLLKIKKIMDDLIVLGIDRRMIYQEDVIFTDGRALDHETKFFDNITSLKELNWDCIFKTKHWNMIDDGKRIRNAEILAYQNIPAEMITSLYCFNEETKALAEKICEGRDMEIKIIDKFFE